MGLVSHKALASADKALLKMSIHHSVSPSLLSGIWDALREPVLPLESLRVKDTLNVCGQKAKRDGGKPFERYLNEVLFLAMRSDFTSKGHQELLRMLLSEQPGKSLLGLPEDPIARLAAVCVKLEMMGFEIDSAPFLRLDPAAGRVVTALFEQRLANHVGLIADNSAYRKLRTLRTRRGFIIQGRLGTHLEPQRLDIYGPHYRHARDWIEALSAKGAWTLEFRDAAGYNPGSPPAVSGFV
ncbi:MAG: hypothetical protein WBX25_36075 [Rhodomicrobium sp.]